VGWGVGPVDVIERMSAILGHVGAWAPRAEQVATTALLGRSGRLRGVPCGIHRRHPAPARRAAPGLPADEAKAFRRQHRADGGDLPDRPPESLRAEDRVGGGPEDERRHPQVGPGGAQIGIVNFQAFGVPDESGWFRLSVGAGERGGRSPRRCRGRGRARVAAVTRQGDLNGTLIRFPPVENSPPPWCAGSATLLRGSTQALTPSRRRVVFRRHRGIDHLALEGGVAFPMSGARTREAGAGVRPKALNLSTFRPVVLPQATAFRRIRTVGMLITHSLDAFSIPNVRL